MENPKEDGDNFNAFVGAETGILKGIALGPKGSLTRNFHSLKRLDKQEEITCMSWGDEGEILTGLRNRMVKVFDVSQGGFTESFDCSSIEGDAKSALRGVARVDGGALITAEESGLVKIWRYKEEDRLSFNTIEVEVSNTGKFKREKDGGSSFAEEAERQKHMATLKAGRCLCRMRRAEASLSVVATGGKENDLQIWDLNKPNSPSFRAKNVPPDHLQLRVPVWVSDLCFPDASSSSVVATANRHGQVRLYDARSGQRRPVQEVLFDGQTLTAICATPNKNQVLVGTTTGQLALFDFRKESRGLFRKYKGCVGSIRAVDCNRDTGYFGVVGLDRFFRTYHVANKRLVEKMYLKSRLNCLLLANDFNPNRTVEEEEDKEDEVIQEVVLEDSEENEGVLAEENATGSVKDGEDGVSEKKRKIN